MAKESQGGEALLSSLGGWLRWCASFASTCLCWRDPLLELASHQSVPAVLSYGFPPAAKRLLRNPPPAQITRHIQPAPRNGFNSDNMWQMRLHKICFFLAACFVQFSIIHHRLVGPYHWSRLHSLKQSHSTQRLSALSAKYQAAAE